MKYTTVLSTLIVGVCCAIGICASANAQSIVHISPRPGSEYSTPSPTIVIRANTRLHQVPSVSLNGTLSGRPRVDVVQSADGTTLNAKSRTPFVPGETVTVNIFGSAIDTSFVFRVREGYVQQDKPAELLQDAPPDMFPLNITTNTTPSPGVFVFAPNNRTQQPANPPFAVIVGNDGSFIHWKRLSQFAFDIKPLPDGRIGYSIFQSPGSGPIADSRATILDTALNVVDSFAAGLNKNMAMHDFMVLPNGNRIVLAQEVVVVDMQLLVANGNPAAQVTQAIVQEVDPDGIVLFQWRSLDYFPVTASYENLTGAAIRYIHNNSIWEHHDGHLILSCRHASTVLKIDRMTGEILWILGGKLNQFTFEGEDETHAPNYFSYQHHVVQLPNGNFTMFDNGTQKTPQFSRGVEYSLDEVNKTCTKVWEYRHQPDIYTSLQGAMQTLPDGHRVFAWGSAVFDGHPAITEIDENNEVVFECSSQRDAYPYKVSKIPWPYGVASDTVLIDEILEKNTYEYTRGQANTGVNITYEQLQSFFYNTTTIRRFPFAPLNARFSSQWLADGKYRTPRIEPIRIEGVQEGIVSHSATFRFNVDVLGLGQPFDSYVVFRRDTIGKGEFTALETRFNPSSRELIVDDVSLGEFAFGRLVSSPDAQIPRRIQPVNGKKISRAVATRFVVSPNGQFNDVSLVVQDAVDGEAIRAKTGNIDSHVMRFDTLGMYYWKTGATIAGSPSIMDTELDSFEVANPFIKVVVPNIDVVWTQDSSYIIRWSTNVPGNVRLELLREGEPSLTIRDVVAADAEAFLWRVPVAAQAGLEYTIRILSVGQDTAAASFATDWTVRIAAPTSVSDNEQLEIPSLTLSPNPVSETLYISVTERVLSVRVFSLDGVQLYQAKAAGQGSSIDVRFLPIGTYLLGVETSRGLRTTTFNVVR